MPVNKLRTSAWKAFAYDGNGNLVGLVDTSNRLDFRLEELSRSKKR